MMMKENELFRDFVRRQVALKTETPVEKVVIATRLNEGRKDCDLSFGEAGEIFSNDNLTPLFLAIREAQGEIFYYHKPTRAWMARDPSSEKWKEDFGLAAFELVGSTRQLFMFPPMKVSKSLEEAFCRVSIRLGNVYTCVNVRGKLKAKLAREN